MVGKAIHQYLLLRTQSVFLNTPSGRTLVVVLLLVVVVVVVVVMTERGETKQEQRHPRERDGCHLLTQCMRYK